MLVTDYECLMLKGWRRCGTYFYKPLMHATCCPMYSIRLEVSKFQMSKSQKKVLKNVQKKLNSTFSSTVPMDDGQYTNSIVLSNCGNTDVEITITIEPASFTEEKFDLYRRYQEAVHKDEPESITPSGFKNFLITSPLVDNVTFEKGSSTSSRNTSIEAKFGTFHHNYRLNGELIAVGVVDMLPTGLSSVYCFYDNNKRDLVLGKYTALKEIEWCQRNHFQYYYMGYYIHDCEKMKYKGEYKPSELLCPMTMQWFNLEKSVPLLEKHKFTPLEPVQAALRDEIASDDPEDLKKFCYEVLPKPDVNKIVIGIGNGRLVHLHQLNERGVEYLTPILEELLHYVGPEVCFRSVVKL